MIHYGIHKQYPIKVQVTDEYFACEQCQIDVRVPRHEKGFDVAMNITHILADHQLLGHTCRVYSRRVLWPPDIPVSAAQRVIAKLTVGEDL